MKQRDAMANAEAILDAKENAMEIVVLKAADALKLQKQEKRAVQKDAELILAVEENVEEAADLVLADARLKIIFFIII